MLSRRFFLFAGISAVTAWKLFPEVSVTFKPFSVIEAVQELLFPKGLDAPAASEFGALPYLLTVATHSSFNRNDLIFLLKGEELLMQKNSDFLKLTSLNKDKMLRDFTQSSNEAEKWVSLLLSYTLEALLSDPIYGGNRDLLGWKWLGYNAGKPRPKILFIKDVS